MKIDRESAEGRNVFTAYDEGWVEVSGRRHSANLVVAGDRVLPGWTAGGFEGLRREEVEALAAMKPEILLLGSGRAFRFPSPALLAPLYAARIGVEVMDTRAACRTYNILLAEGRAVVAAIIVD
ncbi:MAG: Mth938-like domain-containing protein [Betaproteobacteria bacterium]|nr:Mth938-like domain-containing protein [Betaproteobacteria bacterium]